MTDIQADNQFEKFTKYYSQKAIGIATFIGGPLAAGVLVRQNYINAGNEEYGKHALFIGIVLTVIVFGGIFLLPEHIINKVPNSLIPAIYTGIIYLIVERFQGQTLKQHKEIDGQFYSGWKAAGVGAVCMVIIFTVIIVFAFFAEDDFDTVKYDKGLIELQKNEEKALQLFTLIETKDAKQVSDFIQIIGIPLWEKNIQILDELDNIDGLYQEFKRQNQVIREYCKLQIENFQLIEKAITEDTDKYEQQIEEINIKIVNVLSRL